MSPGSILWVEVGSVGSPGLLPGDVCANTTPGVFNGGGALGVIGSGGGGGASDVRMVPDGQAGSLGSRLIVAAGGGGAGGGGSVPGPAGGNAGSAGEGARPGAGAGLSGPGAAGAADPSCAVSALPGGFGTGGAGANDFPDNGGGGGGGGYWGGGGGGCEGGRGSGGGGGASYARAAGRRRVRDDDDERAAVGHDHPDRGAVTAAGPARSRRRARAHGPAGPAGPAGQPRPARPLVVSILGAPLRARPGARVTLRYLATGSAAVEVTVRRGRRTVTRITGRAKPGTNRLKLRAPRARARYALALTARADGGTATDRVRLAVRRPRR